MTPEQELLRNAYLAEMWPTCREHHNTGSTLVEMLSRPVDGATNGHSERYSGGAIKRGRPVVEDRATSDPPDVYAEGGALGNHASDL